MAQSSSVPALTPVPTLVRAANHLVQFRASSKSFFMPQLATALKGVRPAGQSILYKKFKWEDRRQGVRPGDVPSNCLPLRITSKAGGNKTIGTYLGLKVDGQLSKICELNLNQKIDYTCWLKESPTPVKWPKDWKTLKRNLSPVTAHVLKLFQRMKWRFVGQQVVCGCYSTRLGTAVDLVMCDTQGRLLLIEVKTGGGHSMIEACGKMQAPLETLSDCIYHQYHVQMALTRICFESTYPSNKVHESYLILAGDVASFEPLLPRVWKTRQKLFDLFQERRVTPATKRKHEKRASLSRALQALSSGSPGTLRLTGTPGHKKKLPPATKGKGKGKGQTKQSKTKTPGGKGSRKKAVVKGTLLKHKRT